MKFTHQILNTYYVLSIFLSIRHREMIRIKSLLFREQIFRTIIRGRLACFFWMNCGVDVHDGQPFPIPFWLGHLGNPITRCFHDLSYCFLILIVHPMRKSWTFHLNIHILTNYMHALLCSCIKHIHTQKSEERLSWVGPEMRVSNFRDG